MFDFTSFFVISELTLNIATMDARNNITIIGNLPVSIRIANGIVNISRNANLVKNNTQDKNIKK